MRFATLIFLVLVSAAFPGYAKTPDSYKSLEDIPDFVDVQAMSSKQNFMKQLQTRLYERLLPLPKHISFADESGHVTRERLEQLKKLAADHIARQQKNWLSPADLNEDGTITLDELAKHADVQFKYARRLYDLAVRHNDQAQDQLEKIYVDMFKDDPVDPDPMEFFGLWILPFVALDLNHDAQVTPAEFKRPEDISMEQFAGQAIRDFESLLSLSQEGQKISVEDIGHAALAAYNTVDLNNDKNVSSAEIRYYYRTVHRNERKRQCALPSLKDTDGPLYAIRLGWPEALTSVDFHNDRRLQHTYYAHVEVEKQTVPINLVLQTDRPIVWRFKGDVANINKVIVLAPAQSDWKKFYDRINAGTIGITPEKVVFARSDCWKTKKLPLNATKPVIAKRMKSYSDDLHYMLERKPYLVEFTQSATHVRFHSSPGVTFDTRLVSDAFRKPPDYDQTYWQRFLDWKPGGYTELNLDDVHLGAYATALKVMPNWAGLAQLQADGIISELNYDDKGKRAVFMLHDHLPDFVGTHSGAGLRNIIFIREHEGLTIPILPERNKPRGSSICVMTQQSEIVFGNAHSCSQTALAYISKHKQSFETRAGHPVYLRLPTLLPSMVAYKDSLEISFVADEKRCLEEYGAAYREKCLIPEEWLQSSLPAGAVSIDPLVEINVTWKDPSTLVVTPAENGQWLPLTTMEVTINLDRLGLPTKTLLNGQRVFTTHFQTAYFKYSLDDVVLTPHETDSDLTLLYAKIQSNYPLDDIQVSAHLVPAGSILPDEHIQNMDVAEDYMGIATKLEHPHDALYLSMDETKGTLNGVLRNNVLNLPYTHLRVFEPASMSVFSPFETVWMTLPSFIEPELPQTFHELQNRAIDGEAQAQFELGQLYAQGQDVPKSLVKARTWLTKASEQGHLAAQVELGRALFLTNYPYGRHKYAEFEAHYWLSQAAQKEHKVAQYLLGKMITKHLDYTSKDYLDDATYWFEKAAAQNYIPAILELAEIYEKGRGVGVDHAKAYSFYTKAATLGDLLAQAHVARSEYLGLGVRRSILSAYQKAQHVLEQADRSQLDVRDVAARLIASILLDMYPLTPENQTDHTRMIVSKLLDDFKKPFVRMWIVDQLPGIRDTVVQDYQSLDIPIADRVVKAQSLETSDLPELRLVQAKVLMNKGYKDKPLNKQRGVNNYRKQYLIDAVNLLDPLIEDKVLAKDALPLLISLYLSNDDKKTAWDLLLHMLFDRYWPLEEVAIPFAYYLEYTGYDSARDLYKMAGSMSDVQRLDFKKFRDIGSYEASLQKNIQNHPNQAWVYENYARFLLVQKGDYKKSVTYAIKGLKLQDSVSMRRLIGSAYAVNAALIYKRERGITPEVNKFMKLAHELTVTRWSMMVECGMYCADLNALAEAYFVRAYKTLIEHEKEKQKVPL